MFNSIGPTWWDSERARRNQVKGRSADKGKDLLRLRTVSSVTSPVEVGYDAHQVRNAVVYTSCVAERAWDGSALRPCR